MISKLTLEKNLGKGEQRRYATILSTDVSDVSSEPPLHGSAVTARVSGTDLSETSVNKRAASPKGSLLGSRNPFTATHYPAASIHQESELPRLFLFSSLPLYPNMAYSSRNETVSNRLRPVAK
jgi:hypothetical protein